MKTSYFNLLLVGFMVVFQARSEVPATVETAAEKKTVLDDGTEITLSTTSKTTVQVQAGSTKKVPRKVAIFVRNNAGKEFDNGATRIQDQLTAQVSGEHYEIIDFRDAVSAMAALAEALPTADGTDQVNREEDLQRKAAVNRGTTGKPTADGKGATMDQKMFANTSIVRLSQNMDADYLLVLTLDKFNKASKKYKSPDLDAPVITETYTLSASYKILDGYSGGAIGGNTLVASKAVRQTEGLQYELGEFADGLEEELATKMKDDMIKNIKKWREAAKALSGIPVMFNVLAYGMDNTPVYLPKYDGKKQVLNEMVPAQIMANVEIDGVMVGSTPCTLSVTPGLHKVRFERPGHDDVAMTIKPNEGLILSVPMRMTEGEANRLRKTIDFMNQLTMQREINQAHVERLQGEAQMLRQSGLKIDAKEMPKIEMKSLY